MFWVKLLYSYLGCSKSDEDDDSVYRDSDKKVKYVTVEAFKWDAGSFRKDTNTQRWHTPQRLEEFP